MSNGGGAIAGSGALYAIGVLGAWVWCWQQADGVGEHLLAGLKGLVWPAFMVFQVFAALHRAG